MQWGQIKTLFILCFLLLDIYLLFLFIEKEKVDNLSTLDSPELSIEETLESENITISDDLPEDQPDEAYLSVRQKQFSDEETEMLMDLDNQVSEIISRNFIVSQFEDPIPIPEDSTNEEVSQIVQSNVLFAGEYAFESWNKELNIITFFQKKNDRTIYFNQNGLLLVYLNDDNEMIAYSQSLLDEQESNNEKRSLIEPLYAIGALYNDNLLYPGEEVTEVEIGYHTMLPLDNGIQVFVPTWKVTVNENRNHYVNASESIIFSNNEDEFIEEAINRSLEKVRTIEGKTELKESMVRILLEKYEEINNRSEEE
ncbi:hypothetical protein GMD78_07125 [Ornithinibacillus sp. L9]|uniref:Regulatory protein YycH-like domain-containing protein n=1 Tax=Ornithinibacillus caprae TaxID=2678566 RepID=A0A6N8FFF0_9BACI|nr:two-component system regulatory protein YycI [Ornithinibacillus caprae]MUK88165.1 hypothetical protein [Ornithinibacillus caprae]